MSRSRSCLLLTALSCLLVGTAGCGPEGSPSGGPVNDKKQAGPADPKLVEEGKKFVLAAEPAGGKGVIELRKLAKDGEEVVVAGQVGGSSKPFTAGRASFHLVDSSLRPTLECDCPWDFCEVPNEELAAARLYVKFVDAEGKTIPGGARDLFGIRELSTVVVQGKVSRDDKNNVIVLGKGIFVRPEKQ